jgi:DNA-binding transcriptional LysR family regulator
LRKTQNAKRKTKNPMIDAIQAFLDVAAERSFTAVARRRDVAVSSVTRRIDQLEAELGVRLFIRGSRSLGLTDAGERFLPLARNIVGELAAARHALSSLDDAPRGLLSITVPATFGRRHVMPAVSAFLKRYPLIEIDLHMSDQRVDLGVQRVDVAIRMGVLESSDLVATRLATLRRIACASPDYLTRGGRPAAPAERGRHNCLSLASLPLPVGFWCFPGVNADAPLPVRGSLRTDDTEALLQAAVDGIGIVHLASWLVGDALKDGRLVALFPDAPPPARRDAPGIHAVRMPGRSHEARAKLFIDHLREHFGAPPYWDRAAPAFAAVPGDKPPIVG